MQKPTLHETVNSGCRYSDRFRSLITTIGQLEKLARIHRF